MAKHSRGEIGLLVLAGIGAGTLIGLGVGVFLGRRRASGGGEPGDEAVAALTEEARHALAELSESVNDLVGKSRALLSKK